MATPTLFSFPLLIFLVSLLSLFSAYCVDTAYIHTIDVYKINASLLTMSFVCRSKYFFFGSVIVAGTGIPLPTPSPLHIKLVHLQCLYY